MEREIKHKEDELKIIKFDTIESLERRYGIILKAGLRERDRILKAMGKIDQIRERYGKGQRKLNSVEIVRKWRGKR